MHQCSEKPFGFEPLATLSWKEVSFFSSFMQSLKPSVLAIFCGVTPSTVAAPAGQPSEEYMYAHMTWAPMGCT